MNKIIIGIGSIILLIWFICAVVNGVAKTERIECERWKAQSIEYTEWYATEWQRQQCANYGIEI